jgi:hypothetical protein
MNRRVSWTNLVVLVFCAATMGGIAGGCSHSSSAGAPTVNPTGCPAPAGCPALDPATTELSSPSMSFKNDVFPILQANCATSEACHQGLNGSTTPSMSLLYLGGGVDASPPTNPIEVYAILLTGSHEAPSLNYVTPSQPEQSFLMLKMDGDMCGLSDCAIIPASPIPCGAVMPTPCALPGSQRDIVRRWIAQGANNN